MEATSRHWSASRRLSSQRLAPRRTRGGTSGAVSMDTGSPRPAPLYLSPLQPRSNPDLKGKGWRVEEEEEEEGEVLSVFVVPRVVVHSHRLRDDGVHACTFEVTLPTA